jgi:hypothetical protein
MNPEDLPSFTRREALALAATFAVLPTHAGQAQVPAAKLKDLNVGPITWRNIRTDFGAIGNGASSDFVAFRAFRDWALAQTGWIGLVIPPSTGHYAAAGSYGRGVNTPFLGIKKLVVSGYGASMDGLHSGALTNKAEYRHKIRSVKAGSTTVELIDRASVRFLSVGSMVLLAGLDLQGGWGYPPNSHFNEWHRIKSINGWRITFEKPIKYDYRDDWPRYFEGHQHELGGIGPAAICRTIPEWDCEHRIYGLRSISKGQTYYFVRKSILVDVKHDAQGWIIGASEDHQIIGQDHTASHHEVDKLTTRALIADYEPPNKSIGIQSSSVDEMEVRGGTRSIIGTARHMLIHGGSSPSIRLGPTAYGASEKITIRDHVITGAIYGTAGMATLLDDNFTYKGDGVFRMATPNFLPHYWLVPGAVGILRSATLHADHHIFRILGVRSEDGKANGPILVHTDIVGAELPVVHGYANAAIVRHNAPNLTVINCTGCPSAEELSLIPPNSPFGIFTRRTFTGAPHSSVGTPTGPVFGRLVRLKINVVQAYTGSIAANYTLRLGQFQYWIVKGDKRPVNIGGSFSINLRAAGERVITPDGVTGAQTGDSGLSALTGGVWIARTPDIFLGNGSTAVNISGEDASLRPIVTVEALTDQKF